MKTTHSIAFVLLIVGGLNWLLVSLFGWDVGDLFGGQGAVFSKIVYVLVGLSAIYIATTHSSTCKYCENKTMSSGSGVQGRSA